MCFVFMIVIVLMNLLNGLAVSDTRKIQDEAEMLKYKTKVKQISYAESLFRHDFGLCSKATQLIFQVLTGNQGIMLFPRHF